MGRPLIEIDEKAFENLCALQCTLAEIAYFFNCSEDTIERWCIRNYSEGFADTYKKNSAKGKISLRRIQFRLAETNVSMAIWLGKQILNQRDYDINTNMEPIKVVNNVPNETPVVIDDNKEDK
jgi:hypothetical protein